VSWSLGPHGRARASAGGKLRGAGGKGQERQIVMALMVAGEKRIDAAEAADVCDPGFF
jgi:hypothetical protein